MSEESTLISATRQGDTDQARRLLDDGADVHQKDDQGWSVLSWAAGRGDAEMVALFLERGADVTATGRDGRTPRMIAQAAGREEAAALLTAAEKERGVWEDPAHTRPYCKAQYLSDLRKFSGWSEKAPDDEEDRAGRAVVYLHQDLTVTRSMWHGEDVMFDDVTPEWRAYCRDELGFAVPADLH